MPINSLNPYSSNKWTIKARVTSKGEVRNWTNARGAGKLFSVDLLDELGGEIRGTFFNQQVDKFEPLLEKDKVRLRATTRPATGAATLLPCMTSR